MVYSKTNCIRVSCARQQGLELMMCDASVVFWFTTRVGVMDYWRLYKGSV